jgi:biotin carboxyl carrier protein
MMPQIDVIIDGKKYNCCIESGTKQQQNVKINQYEFKVSSVEIDGNLLNMEINQQPETFYCLETENQTQVLRNGFSFLLRSNSLMSQVLLNRKKTGQDKIFQNLICADLFGKVLKLNIGKGDSVQTGQILLTLESMKTEIHVICPVNARVKKIHVEEGNSVIERQLLVELEESLIPNPSPQEKGVAW